MALNRREFLKSTTLGAAGLTLAEPFLGRAAASLLAAPGDRVLVVVNLFGGNDGLDTVVPLQEYTRYRRMRPTMAIPQANILPLAGTPEFGLNPGLTAIRDLYAQGKVAILNGVGVPKEATGLFDHSAQQFEFQTCDVVRANSIVAPTGWLGRYLDTVTPGLVAPGIDMGGGKLMLTGSSFDPLTIGSIDELQLQISFDEDDRRAAYQDIMAIPHADSVVGEKSRLLRIEGLAQSDAIRAATASYTPAVAYPDSDLGRALQQCAQIVYGGLGVRAMGVGAGGFDTHGQEKTEGDHDGLLRGVGDAIGAFYADLKAHALSDRVLILTISEFGRTPFENADRGSDHGYGSVAFAIGDAVKGGVYGDYPHLGDDWLVFGDLLDVTTDFRSVYATALGSFLGVDPVPLVGDFPLLGFV